MSKMKSTALMMAMGMMLGHSSSTGSELRPEDIDVTPKEPQIPKGCKEYFFNKYGHFSTEKMRRDEMVFKCIASNDKNAKKKFQKFQTTNQ